MRNAAEAPDSEQKVPHIELHDKTRVSVYLTLRLRNAWYASILKTKAAEIAVMHPSTVPEL